MLYALSVVRRSREVSANFESLRYSQNVIMIAMDSNDKAVQVMFHRQDAQTLTEKIFSLNFLSSSFAVDVELQIFSIISKTRDFTVVQAVSQVINVY